MKVCYVTHKPNLTGANRSLLDLLDGLDRSQVEPVVLVNRPGPLLNELKVRNIPYRYALIPPTLNSDNPVLNFLKSVLNSAPVNRLAVQNVKCVLRRVQPDLVHNNSLLCSVGMEAANELKLPYICHFRDFLWEDHHRKLLRPNRVNRLIDEADLCISISEAVKEKFQPFATKEIVVLQDGIQTDAYLLPEKDILSKDTVTLLLAGRIHEGKGQLEAVKALELASEKTEKPLKLILIGTVGDPEYYDELCRYLKDHPETPVELLEFSKDISELRLQSDIGLTCSLSEGLGRVTIENMLASLLVIASDSAGTLEIVTDHATGVLYKSGSAEDLADKILWAIHHREEANQIARDGRAFAYETYSCKAYSSKLEEYYESLIAD